MTKNDYIWKRAKGTKTTELCYPSPYSGCPWSITVFLNRGRAYWRVYATGFSKPILKGMSGDITIAKADSVAALDMYKIAAEKQRRNDVHSASLLDFACQKLGTTEKALKAEYLADRDKKEADIDRRLFEHMLKERPDLARQMLIDGGVELTAALKEYFDRVIPVCDTATS